jgi:hypothetical protein
MKTGDVLIVIGAVLVAFTLAGLVVEKEPPMDDQLMIVLSFAIGVGFLSVGLLSNYRLSN